MKQINVVAAVLLNKKKEVLCFQKGEHKHPYITNKYEFPGGKVEAGESEEEAIQREIKEELTCSITPVKHLITVQHSYPDFKIALSAYLCTMETEELNLQEHKQVIALPPTSQQFLNLDWAAADVPISQEIYRLANANLLL